MSEIDTKVQIDQEEAAPVTDPVLRAMMESGVFYGRTKNKTNPRLKQFILANRNGIEIIDLEKTKEQMEEAYGFIKAAVARNAPMIIVATQPSAHETAKAMGAEFSLPVVTRRWLGGSLTNYRVIAKRVEYFKKLKSDLATGAFKSYTKKEQLDLEKEAVRLEDTLAGYENMGARPEVIIVIDPIMHKTAIAEANRLNISVVSLMSTDGDPTLVTHPVMGNTKARSSITWFLGEIAGAIREGKKEVKEISPATPDLVPRDNVSVAEGPKA
jgi:small subunit ribosomal protein S2